LLKNEIVKLCVIKRIHRIIRRGKQAAGCNTLIIILKLYDFDHKGKVDGLDIFVYKHHNMSTFQNTLDNSSITVAELAISHPAALSVFTKYNIDYCCGGNRSLEEACIRLGLNPEKIRQEIVTSPTQQSSIAMRAEKWSAALLVDYIVQNHHEYVRSAIPEIEALLEKVCAAHGEDNLWLLNIQQDFADLAEELISHMGKEEMALFPAIKKLEAHNGSGHPLEDTLKAPITMMEHEHAIAGDLMKSIRGLSNNYTVPEFACPTYRVTYQKLKEFDDDLMTHVHLENNILFRKAGHVCSHQGKS
jgi:regulator of cell morphogenesis and NO signaling